MAKSVKFNEDEYFGISNDASASIFGYLFQAKVALWLFLLDIRNAQFVKVETRNQDIEILFDDKTEFAQVKAQQNYSTVDNAKNKLKSAIISLARTDASDNDSLVYINNFKTPLLVEGDEQLRMELVNYNNLSPEQKNAVDQCFAEIINSLQKDINEVKEKQKDVNDVKRKNSTRKLSAIRHLILKFDKNKLFFGNIYRCSENDENDLLYDVELKLLSLGIELNRSVLKRVFDDWVKILTVSEQKKDNNENESKKLISKKVFSWSIASKIMNDGFSYDEMVRCGVLRQIHSYNKERATEIINDGLFNTESWLICNKIINEYKDFTEIYKDKYDFDFINMMWKNYRDDLSPDSEEEDVQEAITRYKIYKIISKKKSITDVQRKMGCRV